MSLPVRAAAQPASSGPLLSSGAAPEPRETKVAAQGTTVTAGPGPWSRTTSLRLWAGSSTLLFVLYYVAGVFGRHPWKADEPYSFGMVWSMVSRGQWLVPHVANEPFVEKPPLVYWLGALFAKLLPGLAPHESSRLAVLLLVALIVAAVAWTGSQLGAEADRIAQRLRPRDAVSTPARIAALLAVSLLVGTIGFSEHLHKLLADVGQLAGASLGLAGLVALASPQWRARHAGAVLGLGGAIAFLSKGLLVPGMLAVTILLLLALPAWRERRTLATIAIAAAWAVPLILAWLAPFLIADPVLFHEWWWDHNLGRFVGAVDLGGRNDPVLRRIVQIIVMGLPVTLVLPWLLWRLARRPDPRHDWRQWQTQRQGYAVVVAFLVAALATLLVAGRLRDIYILPALLPCVLLALPALLGSPGQGARRFRQVLQWAVLIVLAVVWSVWASLLLTGKPGPDWLLPSAVARSLPRHFAMPFLAPSVGFALLTLALWLVASRTAPTRSALLAWCNGFAVVWTTAALLWLPWVDAARSHMATFERLLPYLAESHHCVATHYLGESERAMLDYASGVPLVKSFLGHSSWGDPGRANPQAEACDIYVVGFRSVFPLARLDPHCWEHRITVARPGNGDERFEVHRRRPGNDGLPELAACRVH